MVVVWTEAREHLWIGDCVTVTVYRGPGGLERTKQLNHSVQRTRRLGEDKA